MIYRPRRLPLPRPPFFISSLFLLLSSPSLCFFALLFPLFLHLPSPLFFHSLFFTLSFSISFYYYDYIPFFSLPLVSLYFLYSFLPSFTSFPLLPHSPLASILTYSFTSCYLFLPLPLSFLFAPPHPFFSLLLLLLLISPFLIPPSVFSLFILALRDAVSHQDGRAEGGAGFVSTGRRLVSGQNPAKNEKSRTLFSKIKIDLKPGFRSRERRRRRAGKEPAPPSFASRFSPKDRIILIDPLTIRCYSIILHPPVTTLPFTRSHLSAAVRRRRCGPSASGRQSMAPPVAKGGHLHVFFPTERKAEGNTALVGGGNCYKVCCFVLGTVCFGAELIASGLSLSLLTVPETFRTFRHAETRVSDVFRSALVLFRVISYSDGMICREICV
ncbi:hypothetical protein C7M84_000368, partial [Penaeus vannamei]